MSQPESEERKVPSAQTVHDAVLREGREELQRTASALTWSGVAAGLAMGLSLTAEGILRARLPDASWSILVSKLGYTVGFVVVTLGRQQLYTENTLTAVLPALEEEGFGGWFRTLRLWGIVLPANLFGALVFAWFATTGAFLPEFQEAFLEIGREAAEPGSFDLFLRGIPAGWLVALIVWLGPAAPQARLWIALLLSYVVGIGEFSHVIAGSVEVLYLVVNGMEGLWGYGVEYLIPTLLGNTAGGVLLVAFLNHSQIRPDDE